MMQKITPCLWFDSQAEEAAAFYTGIIKNSRILQTSYYPEGAQDVNGKNSGDVLTVTMTLNGQKILALNGGPHFQFTPAMSLIVHCDDQAEIDTMWEQLSAGGEKGRCGWLTDKFGFSWQVVPAILDELLAQDRERSNRTIQAIMTMEKLDIAALKAA